jgi:hypothetical protein
LPKEKEFLSAARGAGRDFSFEKGEINRADEQRVRDDVVPFERFAEEEISDDDEDDERDRFLQNQKRREAVRERLNAETGAVRERVSEGSRAVRESVKFSKTRSLTVAFPPWNDTLPHGLGFRLKQGLIP